MVLSVSNHNSDNFGFQAKNIKRQMGLQTELASDAMFDNLEGLDTSGAADEDILIDEDVDMYA